MYFLIYPISCVCLCVCTRVCVCLWYIRCCDGHEESSNREGRKDLCSEDYRTLRRIQKPDIYVFICANGNKKRLRTSFLVNSINLTGCEVKLLT